MGFSARPEATCLKGKSAAAQPFTQAYCRGGLTLSSSPYPKEMVLQTCCAENTMTFSCSHALVLICKAHACCCGEGTADKHTSITLHWHCRYLYVFVFQWFQYQNIPGTKGFGPTFTGNDLDWPLRKLHSNPAKWLPGEMLQALAAAAAAQGTVLSAPACDDKNLSLLL